MKDERMSAQKQISVRRANICTLPNELFKHCFTFLGRGNYIFVAPVSHHFHDMYMEEFKDTSTTCTAALSALETSKYSFENASDGFKVSLCHNSAIYGKLDTLQYASSIGYDVKKLFDYSTEETCEVLCTSSNGHLPILKCLQSNGVTLGQRTINFAAEGGHLSILEWMQSQENQIELYAGQLSYHAGLNGQLHILKWLKKNGFQLSHRLCNVAAASGKVDVLQWCRGQGCKWDETTFACASSSGNFKILEYCYQHDCPFDESACEVAARSGDLYTLKWLRKHHLPWNAKTCTSAVASGSIELLKWARRNNCPWNIETYEAATEAVDFYECPSAVEILNYLYENQCPQPVSI